MQNILEDLENHYDELFLLNFDRGTEHWVHVTHINSPSSFYVRPAISSKFVNKLGSTEPNAKLQSPILHDVVMTKLEGAAPMFARSKITNIENTASGVKCDVFIMDFGYYVNSVPLENIWKCNERYKDIPPVSVHCRLDNCAPMIGNNWPQSTIDAFKFYVGNERARLIILDKTSNQLVVELNNTNPDDIATLLALTGFSTLGWDTSLAYDMEI